MSVLRLCNKREWKSAQNSLFIWEDAAQIVNCICPYSLHYQQIGYHGNGRHTARSIRMSGIVGNELALGIRLPRGDLG